MAKKEKHPIPATSLTGSRSLDFHRYYLVLSTISEDGRGTHTFDEGVKVRREANKISSSLHGFITVVDEKRPEKAMTDKSLRQNSLLYFLRVYSC